VSIWQVSAKLTRFCSRVHARDRSASARLYAYRTQPNVRLSRSACCGAGWKRYLYARFTTRLLMLKH